MNRYTQCFVAGQWRAAGGAELLPVFNPATEEQVAMVRACSEGDVDDAVRAAGRALALWSGSNPVQRRDALQRLAQALEVRAQSFVASYALELGCPVRSGRALQGETPLRLLDATLQALDRVAWSEDLNGTLVRREPIGVVAALCSADAPLQQMVALSAAAVAAGCSLVLKPSELAPGTVRLFCEALEECDLLPGLVSVLYGGAPVGQLLAAHPDVAHFAFTGSADAGHQLAALAAGTGKRVDLALPGKGTALLLDDADVDAALDAVVPAWLHHAGQLRDSVTRLIVPQALLEPVTAGLQARLGAWRVGLPQDDATHVGPVATIERFMRVDGAIASALASGAGLLAGGPGRAAGFGAGHFIAPTLLQAAPELPLAREPVPGPVLCLLAHEGDTQAVRLANGTPYGLSAQVWSRDSARARTVAQRLRCGVVSINGAVADPGAPQGGFGAAGHGRQHGRHGVEALLTTQVIAGGA